MVSDSHNAYTLLYSHELITTGKRHDVKKFGNSALPEP